MKNNQLIPPNEYYMQPAQSNSKLVEILSQWLTDIDNYEHFGSLMSQRGQVKLKGITDNCSISKCFVYADHAPPHCHLILKNGTEVRVNIITFDILSGKFPPGKEKYSIKILKSNKHLLRQSWKVVN